MDGTFSGLGGTLTLTSDGALYGAGWDLTLPYGVDYDPAAALAADPVRIAEGVVSAAAGYNYGLYVTGDGALRFIGSSGIPFAERFAFDGRIREVFAAPDRDVFRLTDDAGDTWVWGNNLSGELEPYAATLRDVVDGVMLTQRWGKAVWRYMQHGDERRCKGSMLEICPWETLGELRRRVSESPAYRAVSAAYGENNVLIKYVKRSVSPWREIRSPNWSEEAYEREAFIDNAVPQRPGIRDQRIEAYCGEERDLTYSIGIYTVNHYLFSPIKAGKEI
ncbi:MAG: hypothetical protein J6S60_00850 [Oscillospiraceae bacterium]|nr:hypothetical protein [Oscillospiraceae bacterium]